MTLLLLIPFSVFLPVLLLCLPYYFFSKWLEKRFQPRLNGRRFLSWFLIVLLSAAFYFWLLGELCIRLVFPKLFGN